MSHTHDVINLLIKKGSQNHRKMSPAEIIDSFVFSVWGIVYQLIYREPYFCLFTRMLQEGQEIVHMIKRAQNVSRGSRWYFSFDFSLYTIFLKIWRTLFLSFLVFESHDLEIDEITFTVTKLKRENFKIRENMGNPKKRADKKKRGAHLSNRSSGTDFK